MRIEPGSREWHQRRARLAREELVSSPQALFYISYVDEDFLGGVFVGGVFVEGHGPITANMRAQQLGINPGGEALIVRIPDGTPLPPPEMRDRLLTREELAAFDASAGGTGPATPEQIQEALDAELQPGQIMILDPEEL